MTRIREEDLPTLAKYLCHFGPVKTCVLGHIYITSAITFYRCVVFMIGCVYGVRCSRPVDQLTDVVTRLDLNHNISPSQVRITCTLVTHIIITCTGTYHSRYVSYVCVSPVHILPALITCTLISNTRYTYHLWRYVSPVHVSSVQVHITYTCITCTGTYHLYAYHLYRYVSPVHVSPVQVHITYTCITCTWRGVVAEWLARSTRVRKDTGFESRWGRSLRNNCGQVVHTHRAQQGRGPA